MPSFFSSFGTNPWRGSRRRRTTIALAALLAVADLSATPAVGALATTVPAAIAPASRPYLRLFTDVGDCAQVRTANQLTGTALTARLDELTSWYVHFHSDGSNSFMLGNDCRGSSSTTLAAKLAARGVWVSNYRNGSFVSQANAGQMNFGEAADIETKAPLAIGTYWPGNYVPNLKGNDSSSGARLTQALSTSSTTIRVSQVPSSSRPAGTSATWPYLSSRGTGSGVGAHSQNTRDFVGWIRVDNELMQVVAEPKASGGDVVLTVRRGLWGTAVATHPSGTRVMAPTYIGNRNSDGSLSGTPSRNSASYPLRYAIKIWQPNGYDWIAGRIRSTFGPGLQGFNTVWLDVSSCHQDNNSDPYGNPVFGWNDPANTKLSATTYGAAQKTKLQGLRSLLPGIRFAGNNMFQNDACAYDLLGNAYDGGVIENYLQSANGSWAEQMETTFNAMVNDWPALYWARWDNGSGGSTPAYKRFTYGSVLLAYRSTDTRYQYGGRWDLAKPDELFFWNWGAPSGIPTQISDVDIPGTTLYRRDFANGIVIVNAGSSSQTYALGGTYFDVVNKDGQGNPRSVTSVTIGARDAAFLMRGTPGGGSDTTPPNTTIASPVNGGTVRRGAITIRGGASDAVAVTSVEIGIQNTTTGRWMQSNGTWGAAYQALPTTLSGSTNATWTYGWSTSLTGRFMVRATARDSAGNRDATPATSTFTVTA